MRKGFFEQFIIMSSAVFWNNLGVSMTHKGEENFKILNFPFGYKTLCILIEKSFSF